MKNILSGQIEEIRKDCVQYIGNLSVKVGEESTRSLCFNWIFNEPKVSDNLIAYMMKNNK